jgi:isocitrate lyase
MGHYGCDMADLAGQDSSGGISTRIEAQRKNMDSVISENSLLDRSFITSVGLWEDSLETGQRFVETNSLAMHLPPDCHQGNRIVQPFGSTLVPLEEAVRRLEGAKRLASAYKPKLKVIACTEARIAAAITETTDLRDRKYLTGMKTSGGYDVYCGGLDAAIGRALIYAHWADVLCYTSARFDAGEAIKFAAAIRSVFPEKQLGFGYRPKEDVVAQNRSGQPRLGSELRRLGYDYYFHSSGSAAFVQSPLMTQWALLDDAARNPSSN